MRRCAGRRGYHLPNDLTVGFYSEYEILSCIKSYRRGNSGGMRKEKKINSPGHSSMSSDTLRAFFTPFHSFRFFFSKTAPSDCLAHHYPHCHDHSAHYHYLAHHHRSARHHSTHRSVKSLSSDEFPYSFNLCKPKS